MKIKLPPINGSDIITMEHLRTLQLATAKAVQEACAKVCDDVYKSSRTIDHLSHTIGKAGCVIRAIEFDAHGIGACKYPACVDNGPDGKCTDWLCGVCPGPQDMAVPDPALTDLKCQHKNQMWALNMRSGHCVDCGSPVPMHGSKKDNND